MATLMAIWAGVFLGCFFQITVLVALTILCVFIGIYMAVAYKKTIDRLFTPIFIFYATVINAIMWGTYYVATGQSWLQTFFKTYILR